MSVVNIEIKLVIIFKTRKYSNRQKPLSDLKIYLTKFQSFTINKNTAD